MATRQGIIDRVTSPELEQFIVNNVRETGVGIGVGAYGSVEEVEIPGALVAAKKLHTQLVTLGSPEQVQKWISDFVAECRLMSQLHHPHIVQFLGICYLPGSRLPVLLMEKLQTSLDNLLETTSNIPVAIKVFLLTGTGRGVVYLHSHTPSIAHRDLTARNVLIDSGLTAKLADLGMAKMVNIQPGQLAATMTRAPGNVLYMPPEAVQEERATRYSTAIDIFSFGVISLFTLTQTFPKDLKAANYFDPMIRRIVGRSEIERREEYIQLMTTALGETHPLVQMTLNCLEYLPEDRPSAVEVLRRLEEVGRTVPQNCTETKLELIRQIAGMEEAICQIRSEHQRQLSEREVETQAQIDRLQADIDRLQADHQEQVCGLQELTTLQQQQLEVQRREIDRLLDQLSSLEPERRALEEVVYNPQGSGQGDVPLPDPREETASQVSPPESVQATPTIPHPQQQSPPRPIVPSSITFYWRRCKDIPQHMEVYDPPVTYDGKLYSRGVIKLTQIVLEYTPVRDEWSELPPLPVRNFTLAILRGKLLVVGGIDKLTLEVMNTILSFDDPSRQWVQSIRALPTARYYPAVIAYKHHLIVAGGFNSDGSRIPDVNILDTTSNRWITAESLPTTDDYMPVLIEDTMYLVGQSTSQVLQAHVPTLMSQTRSGVWESLADVPFYYSSPTTIDRLLFTAGGSDTSDYINLTPTTSIQLFNPCTRQWSRVGDLPEPMYYCRCIELSGQLFVLGGSGKKFSSIHSVYAAGVVVDY